MPLLFTICTKKMTTEESGRSKKEGKYVHLVNECPHKTCCSPAMLWRLSQDQYPQKKGKGHTRVQILPLTFIFAKIIHHMLKKNTRLRELRLAFLPVLPCSSNSQSMEVFSVLPAMRMPGRDSGSCCIDL